MSTIRQIALRVLLIAAIAFVAAAAQAGPYATGVISYTPGTGAGAYTDPSAALGEPSRVTGTGDWVGDVTMFNPPYLTNQIVSVGPGGSLIVGFDHPVGDDVGNPYGLDLLIFGNAFFTPASGVSGCFSEPARVSVSQDGSTWHEVSSAFADDLFPTQGYTDTSGPYSADGAAPSDFTRPVDPAVTWLGKTYAELLPLYGGCGGGTGIDISGTGLPWIQYVKIWLPTEADWQAEWGVAETWTAEIDALADVAVPEPATPGLIALGLTAVGTRRRSKRRWNESSRNDRHSACSGRRTSGTTVERKERAR